MGLTKLVVRGARQHNLKNIDLEIPRNSLTVITGLSGSGKSSLAFDTIYAEGQRRYVESLSAYARQFLDQIYVGFLHELQKLPRVSGEGFDVAALSFRVQRVERERALARARETGDNDQAVAREIEVDVLEVVRARAADADVFHLS